MIVPYAPRELLTAESHESWCVSNGLSQMGLAGKPNGQRNVDVLALWQCNTKMFGEHYCEYFMTTLPVLDMAHLQACYHHFVCSSCDLDGRKENLQSRASTAVMHIRRLEWGVIGMPCAQCMQSSWARKQPRKVPMLINEGQAKNIRLPTNFALVKSWDKAANRGTRTHQTGRTISPNIIHCTACEGTQGVHKIFSKDLRRNRTQSPTIQGTRRHEPDQD